MERYFFQQAYFLDEEIKKELREYYICLKEGDINFQNKQINQLDILDSMVKIIEQNSNNTEERMLDNISKQEVEIRMNNQLPIVEKCKRSDFVIFHDNKTMLLPQILEIHKQL